MRTGSDWLDLANDLLDVGWFNPDRLTDGAALFIVDGLDDALPVDGYGGAAVFFTTEDTAGIKRFAPLFADFPQAFVLLADGEKRRRLSGTLSKLFPALQQLLPADGAFSGHATLRELLDEGGEAAFDRLLVSCTQKPVYGLLDLSEVKKPSHRESVLSGFPSLDRELGGFSAGELTIWTGYRGSGKSTILGQVLLSALSQGKSVFAYSGELPAWQFRRWVLQQAAGADHVTKRVSARTGKEFFVVDDSAAAEIDAWWKGRFFLLDNDASNANEADAILSMMGLAASRYGCTVFLLDNLMTARFATDGKEFYRSQSLFVGRLVEFAKKRNAVVHVVAHPRKVGSGERGADNGKPRGIIDADEIGGSGDIANRADNVFSVTRSPDESEGVAAGVRILKNREYGATARIALGFDRTCRRFYELGSNGATEPYGWDGSNKQAVFSEIAEDEAAPF